MSTLQGVSVRLPSNLPRLEDREPPPDFVPDESPYDLEYDVKIVIAGINAGLYDHIAWTKLRMWLLGLPTINELMVHIGDVDFPPNDFVLLYGYINLKHPNKTAAELNTIFRASQYYLSCHCTAQVRNAVLSYITGYTHHG